MDKKPNEMEDNAKVGDNGKMGDNAKADDNAKTEIKQSWENRTDGQKTKIETDQKWKQCKDGDKNKWNKSKDGGTKQRWEDNAKVGHIAKMVEHTKAKMKN